MFFYLGGYLCLVVSALFLRIIKNKFEIASKLYTYLANIIFWNLLLRMFLEGYLAYAITSILNLYKVKWDSKSDAFSSIFSIIMFGWIIFFPLFLWVSLRKNYDNLSD